MIYNSRESKVQKCPLNLYWEEMPIVRKETIILSSDDNFVWHCYSVILTKTREQKNKVDVVVITFAFNQGDLGLIPGLGI